MHEMTMKTAGGHLPGWQKDQLSQTYQYCFGRMADGIKVDEFFDFGGQTQQH